MPLYFILLAAAAVAITAAIYFAGRRAVAWASDRGLTIYAGNQIPTLLAMLFGLSLSVATHAQSTLDIDIDLSNFWTGFNQFFSALFPPLAFIASISAALGFIFLIIGALKNAFGGRAA